MTGSVVWRVTRWLLLLGFAAFFAIPLLSMLDFSTQVPGSAPGRTGQAWLNLVEDPAVFEAIVTSLLLSLFTVVMMIALLVPTMIWVRLRVPRASRLVEYLCLLPLTIPALVIVVGISNVYAWVTYLLGDSALVLTFAYVVLVLPYSYRAIDAALSSIDVATLAEAGRSLGAGWFTVIARIVLPNIVPGVLSAAFISVALVLGEFTFASLLNFETLPVVINLLGKSNALDRGRRVARHHRLRLGAAPVHRALQQGPTYEWREVLVTQTDVDGRPGKDDGASRSVRLHDLTRDFGSFRALDGFDLRMAPGELVALLGPSGCGKTTVLRILAGLDHPTTGHVEVGGRDITRVPANKRDMGMVFQAYSLFPHLTVLDNVAFGLKLRGQDRSARRRRASEVLDLVGLGEHTAKYANQLSGGQQQRVALARALAIEPSVLLLDEPLSALDAKVRVQLRDEIRRVQLEVGTTTLFVTHDQEEALAVADRVGVMNRGRLEQLAPPSELYADPASQFVAEFVGLNNKVAAVVSDRRATVLGAAVPTIEGSISSGPGQALVRPESVTITADGPANATVASVNFLGPVSRVYVDVDDAELLMADVPSPLAVRLNPGDRVAVGVEPTPLLVVATPSQPSVATA